MPYDLTPEFLEELFTKHRIDYVVHGDDPCLLPDGTDAYAHAKKQGRFRMVSCACSHPALNRSQLSRDVPSVATCCSPPSNQIAAHLPATRGFGAVISQTCHCLQIKRTEGVSSTDIVGRMLMCTRSDATFSAVSALNPGATLRA